MRRIPPERLRALRNDIPLLAVICNLQIPSRLQANRVTFRCPSCQRFQTALSRRANLGRCFPCRRTFNPIDLVMAERGSTFLEAVRYLDRLYSVSN